MNKTDNYQLSQWEKTDRIMMEDFNRDNANIEAALAAEQAARAAGDGLLTEALNSHSHFVKFQEFVTTTKANQVDFDISGLNWSNWFFVLMRLKAVGNGSYQLRGDGGLFSVYTIAGGYGAAPLMNVNLSPSYPYSQQAIFFNTNVERGLMNILSLAFPLMNTSGGSYNNPIKALNLWPTEASNYISPGTALEFWGVK